ncbi:hypothetical protein A3J90_02550 [candidate division WOR-1 bacterium RIFOXYC2_FULL_37_10]|uniref:DNA methylase N-4/N-6 domain-containing protein n=1 Tax=candidate division WOR-1 bacterium RIFOXYB2_FULL_37_13 TaxID=1802579 RepID=A0A1F4STH7_UNCSA|nr:MAG: hypothetical protein A2310_00905 [candidate division WOR-1 bacterium RIFOXYB2_FULL_37_13]OGC35659.1 MAG: hypothetical protein A3J90_02550 [candidate division WOR-1 bacterium RIFOXYC2_FULL_37_10]
MASNNKQKLELTWVGKNNPEYDIANIEPRILEENPELSNCANDPNTENMIIHGDNLLALKALLPEYEGKIKCIYIDPPYNTGNAFDHYDDSVEHSTWLSLMKPRLELLRILLREDGSIWISIDEKEGHYLKILCDEIFNRENFIIQTTIQRGSATGHKAINPTPVQVCDLMLCYAKRKTEWIYKPVYRERGYDKAYSQYINNFEAGYEKWKFVPLKEILKEGNLTIESALKKFPERIIRFAQPDYNAVGKETREYIELSKLNPSKLYKQLRTGYPDIYLFNGNRILFYKDKMREINGVLVTAELVTNIWTDMNYQGIASEGGVVFQRSKKPELQIKRVIEMSTNPSDLILDSFLGSGTTSAVAHKMGRKYIGIEMGNHAYTHCKARLDKVIDGSDQGGISKSVDWKGGGAYKFYELAPSFIVKDEFGNPVIDSFYNDTKLIKAMCKLMNFTYQPSQTEYWKHGVGQGKNYLYVTTQLLTTAMIQQIAGHLTEGETLIICPKKFEPGAEKIDSRITIKKIPHSVLKACYFGKKEYLLPIKESATEEVEIESEAEDNE